MWAKSWRIERTYDTSHALFSTMIANGEPVWSIASGLQSSARPGPGDQNAKTTKSGYLICSKCQHDQDCHRLQSNANDAQVPTGRRGKLIDRQSPAGIDLPS